MTVFSVRSASGIPQTVSVVPRPRVSGNGWILLSADIRLPGGKTFLLWFRVPATHEEALTQSDDPFAIAASFPAMKYGADLMVHGTLSPSLMRNLETLSVLWSRWRPGRYHPIRLRADRAAEQEPATGDEAIAAFSGGLDSCYTVFSHTRGLRGQSGKRITAGLMIHGCDIPVYDDAAFRSALQKSRHMLDDLHLTTIPMATNIRECGIKWEEAHISAISACLSFFGGKYRYGLIAGSSHSDVLREDASHPDSDPLYSSSSFIIRNDADAITRSVKTQALMEWPAALRHLRVCWEGPEKDRNCGRCEKCIRTILNFRACGAGLPPCFDRDATDAEVRRIRYGKHFHLNFLGDIVETAEKNGIDDAWVSALRENIEWNRRRLRRPPFLRTTPSYAFSRIRERCMARIMRGTPLPPGTDAQ